MRIAQSLFEGVSVPGRGPVGLITYMRTDSLRIAPDAINGARTFISERYEAKYLPAKPNFFASKARSQDAHEAIRPTDVTLTPEILKMFEFRTAPSLYPYLNRFVASQMASALLPMPFLM